MDMHSSEDQMAAALTPAKPGFAAGLRASLPIAIGYLPIAVTFGLVARSADIPAALTILMSLIIFAGASQFVAVNLIALGTNPWEIILTTFMLNLRHLLMSASLTQRIEPASRRKMAMLAFGVTDETFSVASLREERQLSPGFILGLNLLAFFSWVAGTCLGVSLVNGIPASLQASMGIALYAMFIGLLIPALRKNRHLIVLVLLASVISALLYWLPAAADLSAGWKIVITTVLTALAGAYLFPGGVDAS